MLQRVKEVQESDLRMDGALARNIQRVLAVTQADIDAAAAQGKGWLVKRVVKVNDPLDNLRGGTQLVIKQNSILPGQNVMRVLYAGSGKTVGPAVAPLSLPGAAADDILSLIAFGGTEQGGVPTGYKALNGIANGSGTYVDTGIIPAVDDVEIEIRVKPTTGSWYILQNRASGGTIWGISGSSTGSTILLGWGGLGTLCQSSITRDPTHTYYIKATMNNGNATLYVKDETANTEDTKTNTYTSAVPTLPFWLYGNQNNDRVAAGNTVYMARVKVGGVTVMDYVPALNPSMVVGFYDKATGNFKVSDAGTLTADQTIVPTPDAPMDIVCNNGVLKARHESGLPTGYALLDYATFDGTQVVDTGLQISTNDEIRSKLRATATGFAYGADTSNPRITLYMSPGGNQRWGTGLSSTSGVPPLNTELTVIQNKTSIGYNGTDYSMSATDDFTTTNTLTIGNCNGNTTTPKFSGNFYYMEIYQGGSLAAKMVPVKASDNTVGFYDLVRNQFFAPSTGTLVAGSTVSDPVEVYTAGPIETIAIKDDQSATVSTATCEDLFAIGTDYVDQQEVISGTVTRKLGVYVFDGSETFQNGSNGWITEAAITDQANVAYLPFCTHFGGTDTTPVSGSNTVRVYRTSGNAGRVYFGVNKSITEFSTAAKFQQWVADQYAAGTPVIIVYVLATPTTDTVTPQPMQTAAGDNAAEITQAGMAGLELEVEYVEA